MKLLNVLSLKRNSKISKLAKIYALSKVSNSIIDDHTYISFSCTINNSEIGKFCSIASGVKIGLGKHPINFVSTSPLFYAKKNPLNFQIVKKTSFTEHEKVYICNDVWIGTNAVILDGITIGNGAIIGANSVVTKNVEPYSIVGGVPAKEIKKRFSKEIIEKLENLKWWNLQMTFFKQKKIMDIFSKPFDENSVKILTRAIEEIKNKN
jgi:acetyltransferase-like isoleucine patch superfamily enzyme